MTKNRYIILLTFLGMIVLVTLLFISNADRRNSFSAYLRVISGQTKNKARHSLSKNASTVSGIDDHNLFAQMQDAAADQIIEFKLSAIAKTGYGPGVYVVPPTNDIRLKRQKIDGITLVTSRELLNFRQPLIVDNKHTFNPDKLRSDKNMYLDPTDISGTDLDGADFSAYSLSGTYLPGDASIQSEKLRQLMKTPSGKTGWTGLTRVFENHRVFGRVILAESDIAAAELSVMIEKDFLNAKVGEFPATLMKMRDDSGGTMSTLRWFENNAREYEISVNQIDDKSTAALVQMAESISRARRQ